MADEQEYELDEEEYFKEDNNRFRNITTILMIIFALVGFAVLGWYGYKINSDTNSNKELVVIKASEQPIKVVPENPGGMVINDVDKNIYDNLSESGNQLPPVKKVIPSPEEPVLLNPKNETQNENIYEKQIIKHLIISPSEEIERNDKKIPLKEEKIEEQNYIEDTKLEKFIENKSVAMKREKPKELPAPLISNPTPVQPAGYYLQISSMRTYGEAEQYWHKITTNYSKIIGDLKHYIIRKDLGEKGIFFRLQIGHFSDMEKARKKCQQLKKCKLDCFVIKVK
jgi:hypothetical protein